MLLEQNTAGLFFLPLGVKSLYGVLRFPGFGLPFFFSPLENYYITEFFSPAELCLHFSHLLPGQPQPGLVTAWYNGPFWPSKLRNQCDRILLSSESRTNIWPKLHCFFFGCAGPLLASTRWPSLASWFKSCIVIILLRQAATWSLMFAPKPGLRTLVQQICFNICRHFFLCSLTCSRLCGALW